MTSWSVVFSISAIRVDVDPGPRLDGRERVRRDLVAARLGAAHGELDLEHPLEAGLLGPQRAHLGQRVARDHAGTPAGTGRSRAMSRRRCSPSHAIASAARSAASRAACQRRPATDDRQHPAAVRAEAALRPADRPGVEHEGALRGRRVDPGDRVAPARVAGVALGRQHDADGSTGQLGDARRRVVREPAVGGGERAAVRGIRRSSAGSTCASGSPRRTLHSSSAGPSAVSISPA